MTAGTANQTGGARWDFRVPRLPAAAGYRPPRSRFRAWVAPPGSAAPRIPASALMRVLLVLTRYLPPYDASIALIAFGTVVAPEIRFSICAMMVSFTL